MVPRAGLSARHHAHYPRGYRRRLSHNFPRRQRNISACRHKPFPRAVRHGNYKAIRDEKSTEWELYDVVADRTERHNLAAEKPEMLKAMIEKWNEWAAANFVLPKRAEK